jgi:hypothetical protein
VKYPHVGPKIKKSQSQNPGFDWEVLGPGVGILNQSTIGICPGQTTPIAPGSATDEMLPFAGLHEVIGEKPRSFLSKVTERKDLHKKDGV